MQVGQARHDLAVAVAHGAFFGVGDERFEVVDGHAHGDAGGLVDFVAAARLESDLGHHVLHELRHPHRNPAGRRQGRLLIHDRDLVFDGLGIVGTDLNVEAILERGDNPTP